MFRYWSLVKLLTNSGHRIEAGRAEMMVEIQQQHHETVQTCLTTSIYLQNSTHSGYNTGTQKWLLPFPIQFILSTNSLSRVGKGRWKLCRQTPTFFLFYFPAKTGALNFRKSFAKLEWQSLLRFQSNITMTAASIKD